MSRRTGPALYELLGRKPQGGANTPTEGQRQAPPTRANLSPAAGSSMDPAHLRSLVLAAVVVFGLIAAYLVGVSRGERLGRSAAISESEADTHLLARANDARGNQGATSQAPSTGANPNASENTANGGTSGSPAGSAAHMGPVTPPPTPAGGLAPSAPGVDPRVAGLNYFVLASTLEPNALKIVAFCRDRGLDAWVVPDQNGRLREVTVLPGFEHSNRSSPEVRELDERIRNVGVLFKASGSGNSDFGDRYHKLFK